MPETRAFVFDAYGTLFDVHSAVMRHAAAMGPDAQAFSDTWRAKQLEYSWVLTLAGRWVDFWILTQRALDFAFDKFPQADRGLRPALLDAYRVLSCYPDSLSALTALRTKGFRTAILSNGESGMLDAAVSSANLTPLLDAVWSVDSVKLFKPRPEVYALATRGFGLDPQAIAFVSSNRWDVAGAAAFGFKPFWINRSGQPNEYPRLDPAAIVENLQAIVEA